MRVSALDDSDAWVRWKALRGIAELGMETSRGAVETRAADPETKIAATVKNPQIARAVKLFVISRLLRPQASSFPEASERSYSYL